IAILTNLRNQTDARSLAKLVADMLSVMTHYYTVPLVGRAFNHWVADARRCRRRRDRSSGTRSEEHTSELQSLMRISYAVFCLKTQTLTIKRHSINTRYR